MAGTGAILSLKALGKQDTFLTSNNIQNSFWTPKSIQHTNFTMYYRSHYVSNNQGPASNWPFGETISFVLDPKASGDVLANCFLKLTLPSLSAGERYCSQVGRVLIKEYSFRVGDTVVQTVPGDWGIIHDELYSYDTERYAHRFMVNGGAPDGTLPPSTNPLPIYLPLNFFFSRFSTVLPGNWYNNETIGGEFNNASSFKSYFMMCACKNQNVTVSISFNNVPYFSNTASTLTLDKIQLVTEEYTLSPEEINYYRNVPQTMIYNTAFKQPKLPVDNANGVKNTGGEEIPTGCPNVFKDFMVANKPVKAFHWFLRDQRYESDTDSTHFLNRFNFSTGASYNPDKEQLNPIMSDAILYLNGEKQMGYLESENPPFTKNTGANYYKYVQSFIHKYNCPQRNIYTYSFSLNPREPSPSGSLDFSVMDSTKTVLKGHIIESATSNAYNLNMLYLGYVILKYDNDYCSLVFS